MVRRRTKAAKQAQALLVWLESLELPARVINALGRDLEVVTGEREGEEEGGVLAGFDQARFTEELYQKRGGQVGKVPSVAKSAIEALRAAIPAPVSGDGAEATPLAQDDQAPAIAASAASEAGEAVREVALEAAPTPGTEETSADSLPEPIVEATEAEPATAAEATDEPAEPVEAPATPPRRRGRPRRTEANPQATEASAAASTAPAKRPGPPRRHVTAPVAPVGNGTVDRGAAQPVVAPPAQALAPAQVAPPLSLEADPSFAVLLQLWRELHPQGQRAAMHYMAGLLVKG